MLSVHTARATLKYDPEEGSFLRLHNKKKVYLHPNTGGSPRIAICGKEYSARHVAWLLMTGEYPGKFELKSLDGNLSNVKWSNLYKAKADHKFCSKCKEEKHIIAFSTNKSRSAGVEPICKQCKKPYNKKSATKQNLKKFGLTVVDYNNLLAKQNGVCGICKKPEAANKRLAVDHCHDTGIVRGLLCMQCNTAIGKLNSKELLSAAIEYFMLDTPKNFRYKNQEG